MNLFSSFFGGRVNICVGRGKYIIYSVLDTKRCTHVPFGCRQTSSSPIAVQMALQNKLVWLYVCMCVCVYGCMGVWVYVLDL